MKPVANAASPRGDRPHSHSNQESPVVTIDAVPAHPGRPPPQSFSRYQTEQIWRSWIARETEDGSRPRSQDHACQSTRATRGPPPARLNLPSAVPTPPKPNIAAASNLPWVAPFAALRYSGYMATAKKPPDKLAGSLRHRQTSIDEMRASARMYARLMKKTPKSMDFPHGLVEVTNPGPSQRIALVRAATGTRIDPSAL